MTFPNTIAQEQLRTSQNGTAPSKPQQTSSGLDKLLTANTTLTVWLIFFTIGGGILALYYAKIGYLPDMEWRAALIYLFVGSMVGGAIGLLLTISLYIPGVLWSEFIIFDSSLNFSYVPSGSGPSSRKPDGERCLLSTARYLGSPFLIALFFSHSALLVGSKSFWMIALGILALTFWTMWKRFDGLLKHPRPKKRNRPRHLFKYCAWFTLSVLLSQISMYVIYWLSGTPGNLSKVYKDGEFRHELGLFVVLTLMCTAGCWISNHVVALRHKQFPRQAVVAALLAAGLLLFTADYFSCLSMKLMNHYGFGDGQEVSLLLNDDGVAIAKALQLCDTSNCPKILNNVEILSKMGEQYFLKVGDKKITLPKRDVDAVIRLDQH